mgnify:CR=1 FL=1
MKKLIIATHNAHKAEEIQHILNNYTVLTLDSVGFTEEIEEVGETFEENAMLKAVSVYDYAEEIPVLADDSGLEIETLNNAPGVYSARYAGTDNSGDNIQKVLQELQGKSNRLAQFRCVLCLFDGKKEYYFEGIVKGKITTEKIGKNGFGYDPIFIPEGYDKTFAQMSAEEKNSISHRGLALQKLKDFLEKM